MSGLLAHHWTVGDISFFVVPAVLAVFAIRWAERRSRERRGDSEESDVH